MLAVIAADHGKQRVDALGLSLSGEFVARVAADEPTRFRSLTLVTPTGFRRGSDKMRAATGTNREVPGLYRTLTFPLWRGALYGALVSRVSIRYFLERTFGSKSVDDELVDYALVYFEKPAEFFKSWDAFLSRAQSVG